MFKQKKHRNFNYKPRFQDSNKRDREENSEADFGTKWRSNNKITKKRGNVLTSLPMLIIMLAAIIILMYVLESYI